ncbi:nitroreductase family protein [Haloferula sargassicola]|uniref:Nitroreductase domain-containing protein n=1 Tax=Haloferula sargassicola TaxID=490096 RepID=A0ABP9UIK8_9BACT
MEANPPEATTRHEGEEAEILPLLRERWSPYCFSDREIEADKLKSVLEAGRWAPSSYNEQPWAYLMARRSEGEPFEKILSCLVEANQAWAKNVAVLMLSFARKNFSKNGKPNPHHVHDLGGAAAHMTFQASAHGLFVHQMAGIDREKIRQTFDIPDTHEPVTAIAIGYLETAPGPDMAELVERDQSPDRRRSLSGTFFGSVWGEASPLFQ